MEVNIPEHTVSDEYGNKFLYRGVVRTGATGAMAPVDFENMCFGTRRFETKRLKSHREMPAKTIFSCTKLVIGTR